MEKKPLHVQVAEALGMNVKPWMSPGPWMVMREDGWPDSPVSCYDIDWSVTGPLIEKYEIDIGHEGHDIAPHDQWYADKTDFGDEFLAHGPTPLIAVCNLILTLKKEGKL